MKFDIGNRIFDYTKPELERKVDEFIRRRPFLGNAPPVYPDLILIRMPEVTQIEPDPGLMPTYKAEAMVLARTFMHRELKVVVDEWIMNHADGAPFNMALAEEIGHIELHRAVIMEIDTPQDFLEVHRHPRWAVAERDAKYFGRALLMPSVMMEPVASDIYRRVAAEIGFSDAFRFDHIFAVHMASTFEIPLADAKKRIDAYTGGLRSRLDMSIAAKSDALLSLTDEIVLVDADFKAEVLLREKTPSNSDLLRFADESEPPPWSTDEPSAERPW